jgi:hypothetical protein
MNKTSAQTGYVRKFVHPYSDFQYGCEFSESLNIFKEEVKGTST